MKNLKNIATALTLAAVLSLGTFTANAGWHATDEAARSIDSNNGCQVLKTSKISIGNAFFRNFSGILASGLTGMLLGDFTSPADNGCGNNEPGMLLGDNPGMLLGDTPGMLLGD